MPNLLSKGPGQKKRRKMIGLVEGEEEGLAEGDNHIGIPNASDIFFNLLISAKKS